MSSAAPYLALLTVSVFPWSDKDQLAPALILHKCGVHARPLPLKLAGCIHCRRFQLWELQEYRAIRKISLEGALTVNRIRVVSSELWLMSDFLMSVCHDKTKEKPMWVLPLPVFWLIHMKLMLFTHFLQTHQPNLHPPARFPPLSYTQNNIL